MLGKTKKVLFNAETAVPGVLCDNPKMDDASAPLAFHDRAILDYV